MLWGAANGGQLELRRSEKGGVRLVGRFPYDTETTLAPGRAERIAAGAFAARIDAGEDIHLLSGHDYAKPLASRAAGTLILRNTAQALELEATITPDMERASWAQDFLSAQAAGLIRGLSPGFVVAEGGEIIERSGDGLLRTITAADLFELSAVTVPAYGQAQIEARNWKPAAAPSGAALHPSSRWR
jgi:HK97 family phage prohead protease